MTLHHTLTRAGRNTAAVAAIFALLTLLSPTPYGRQLFAATALLALAISAYCFVTLRTADVDELEQRLGNTTRKTLDVIAGR